MTLPDHFTVTFRRHPLMGWIVQPEPIEGLEVDDEKYVRYLLLNKGGTCARLDTLDPESIMHEIAVAEEWPD